MIEIANGIYIPEDALVFKVSRSSGPGGQNVNKLSTRVTVLLDVGGCASLSDAQQCRILARLANRADKNGVIRVVCQKYRTQKANRRGAVERLQQLLAEALKTRPVRVETEVPYAARRRRLDQKRQRSLLKRQRATKNLSGDFGD
jgi:ribosome-associated protein